MKSFSKILCFDETTSVRTVNGVLKIKDIQPGEHIISYDETQKETSSDIVMCTAKSLHSKCAIISFENGTTLKATVDHPLMVLGKGWCVVHKDGVGEKYGVSVDKLEMEDECVLIDCDCISTTKVLSIEVIPCSEYFYCLSTRNNHNFLANGIVAHDVDITRFSQECLVHEGVEVHGLQ